MMLLVSLPVLAFSNRHTSSSSARHHAGTLYKFDSNSYSGGSSRPPGPWSCMIQTRSCLDTTAPRVASSGAGIPHMRWILMDPVATSRRVPAAEPMALVPSKDAPPSPPSLTRAAAIVCVFWDRREVM